MVSFWESLRVRLKLKHHAAKADGILQIMQRPIVRSKLKNHAAEAGGILCELILFLLFWPPSSSDPRGAI